MRLGKSYYTLFRTTEKIPGREYQSKATEDDCEEWEEVKTKARGLLDPVPPRGPEYASMQARSRAGRQATAANGTTLIGMQPLGTY
jgi:hypothetical protein